MRGATHCVWQHLCHSSSLHYGTVLLLRKSSMTCSVPQHVLLTVLHRCPYYRTAEQNLYGRLLTVDSDTNTKYWSDLAGATVDMSQCDSGFIQVQSLGVRYTLTSC